MLSFGLSVWHGYRFTGDYEISAVAYVLCMCVCQGGVLSVSSKVAPLGYRVLTFDF